jgi:hypothetical protein
MIIIISNQEEQDLKDLTEIIAQVRSELKNSDIAKEICQEYNFNTDIIDGLSITFSDDLESSAKTVDSKIQLSTDLLNEGFEIIMRYAIHELVHALQHLVLKGIDPYTNKEYLDRDDEVEAFQFQIAYDSEERGIDKVEDYVDDLLEYHEIPNSEKEDKKEELLEKV